VPVLCAHKGGTHSIRELPGGRAGVVPHTDYREEAFTLDEDSALVMVTDGVVEGPGLTLKPDWTEPEHWPPRPSTTG
jgi:serine phosphatase RsbU (regulator of sigma subunit)